LDNKYLPKSKERNFSNEEFSNSGFALENFGKLWGWRPT